MVAPSTLAAALDADAAWEVLSRVLDPEVPVLSVVELGMVRAVAVQDDRVLVTLTPTYSGCPATEAIEQDIRHALMDAGALGVDIRMQWTPAWTTDWISMEAAEKLRRYGIAPPGQRADRSQTVPIRFAPRAAQAVACPQCGAANTERLTPFGATACKALYRCLACREPFEHFKTI